MLFFFKQNTGYEMRISDWSSDVCSSDLFERRGRILVDEGFFHGGALRLPFIEDFGQRVMQAAQAIGEVLVRIAADGAMRHMAQPVALGEDHSPAGGTQTRVEEIGRAHV